MPSDDLWGELPIREKLRTPASILREQAAILEKKTDGLLLGRVRREVTEETFSMYLYIVAPALNNYSYRVLGVDHQIELYPLEVFDFATGDEFDCQDESAFKAQLKEILSSDSVRKVVIGLLAQVRGLD